MSIVHQTGEADFEKVRDGYKAAGWAEAADVREYIDDMVSAFAADDHQRKNAEALERAGASRMVLQQDATGERLAKEISDLVENPDRVTRMEEAARALARGDAAAAAVDLMEKLVGKGKK